MSQKLHSPDSPATITPLDEFNRAADQLARQAAGLPEYDMDDPERPFTEEYDPPKDQVRESGESVEVPSAVGAVPEDTTPSADNRELYEQPTPARLREIRQRTVAGEIKKMRLTLHAAAENTDEKQKNVHL